MLDCLILSENSIGAIYKTVSDFYEKRLRRFGVKLPKLRDSRGNFTKDALVLVYLANGYPKTRKVSKEELTKFVRSYYPNTNDVQQARHLGAQKGWWIVAGGRDNIVLSIGRGFYQLYTLERPYPGYKRLRRGTRHFWLESNKRKIRLSLRYLRFSRKYASFSLAGHKNGFTKSPHGSRKTFGGQKYYPAVSEVQ